MDVDVLIIGGGPIGLACGIEAKAAGLSYVIIEKGALVNSIYHYPLNMTFFSTSDRLEIGEVPFISHGPKPNRAEALEYFRRVCMAHSLNIRLYEEVKAVEEKREGFVVRTSGSRHGGRDDISRHDSYAARNVVLALGFYDRPYLLNIPGEDLPKVKHYYDEPHPYFAQKIVVVGAANSAVDVALETYRKGAEVTMVIRESELSKSVKYWVKPDMENRIKEGSIRAFFESTVTEIRPEDVVISTPKGLVTLKNDFVLAMTGYQPPFEFMASMGLKFQDDEDHTPVYNEETMESNVKGIYLAGVVCGGLRTNKWFIENSRVHATQIIKAIKEGRA
jgi:thioredoxin reductase (NADPH)